MIDQTKETAIQNKQQLDDNSNIIKEFQKINQTLKDIANVLWHMSGIKM